MADQEPIRGAWGLLLGLVLLSWGLIGLALWGLVAWW